MIIKLVYNKEIHLFKLENPVLEQIKNHIIKLHPQINQNYNLFYKDDDGDSISISSDEDLKVLMESVKNQTVKITIEPFNTWICKYCTFENLDGIICGACSQYKEPGPQQQQQQQYVQYNQPQYPAQSYPPQQYLQQPPFIPPQHFPQFGMIPPQMPPHLGQFEFGHPPHHMFGGFHHHFKHHHRHHHMKWHKLKEIMKNPQFKQQKEKLQQLLKEVSQTLKNTIGNQQYYQYQQQWPWSDLDEQRATRLAEVLQCNQEQAREYLMIFRDLTLDEIVMMVENAE
ncbi:unnamed protein product [Paramecium sonneborni]|uniref:PB1 domain-containing protein n=1 Tax=Paramecium sonneborni TaxID=65129 RepID=A0A8S1QRB4_9CILI|nr:unnamed protein product [Paramecium sonneborni]